MILFIAFLKHENICGGRKVNVTGIPNFVTSITGRVKAANVNPIPSKMCQMLIKNITSLRLLT
jgi:hypothetical protein